MPPLLLLHSTGGDENDLLDLGTMGSLAGLRTALTPSSYGTLKVSGQTNHIGPWHV